jgi:class 3 adenylate cyclase
VSDDQQPRHLEMNKRRGIDKDSLEGHRISACIEMGIPICLTNYFGNIAHPADTGSLGKNSGQFLFQTVIVFSTAQRGGIAVFDRSSRAKDGGSRRTSGKGVLYSGGTSFFADSSFEAETLKSIAKVDTTSIRALGQGLSHRGQSTYVMTVFEATLPEEQVIHLANKQDRFVGFFDSDQVLEILGQGRELDRAVLSFLNGNQPDTAVFTPSEIDCTIQSVTILGLDIEKFSIAASEVQVLRYLTLQVLLKQLFHEDKIHGYAIQTGDGYFVVSPERQCDEMLDLCLKLQARLAQVSGNDAGRITLRYALHQGPAFQVVDLNNQTNFIGDGMNYCARLLATKDANVIVISRSFHELANVSRVGVRFEILEMPIKHRSTPDQVFIAHLS